MKRLLCAVLCLLVCISILGTAAAEAASDVEGGYIITTDQNTGTITLSHSNTEEQLELVYNEMYGKTLLGVELSFREGCLPYSIAYADEGQCFSALDFLYDVKGLSGLAAQYGIYSIDRQAMEQVEWGLYLLGSMNESNALGNIPVEVVFLDGIGQTLEEDQGWVTLAFDTESSIRGFAVIPDGGGGYFVKYMRTMLFFEEIEDLVRFVDEAWEYSISNLSSN